MMTYNDLWLVAYQFAMYHQFAMHRAEQFAADYARYYEGTIERDVPTPGSFEVVQISLDFHYHG